MRHSSLLVAPLLVAALSGGAAGQTPASSRPLTVGVYPAPPFAVKTADGDWRGVSVDLWRMVAGELSATFVLREVDPNAALAGLAGGALDVLASPLVVTPEREELIDFSHIFYTSGLGIAVPRRSEGVRWRALVRALFSPELVAVLLGLLLLLTAAGTMAWLVERRRNPDAFGGTPVSGIGAGFWWSSVTFTGVGYGDKVPVTLPGRAIAVAWMLASTVLVSAFTGFITARVAIGHFEQVRGRADLPNFRLGALAGSAGERYLERAHIHTLRYATLAEALSALARQDIDALVHDEAVLRYAVRHDAQGAIQVLPEVVEREYYAFALPSGSPLREPLNVALLKVTARPAWQDLQHRYLGSP